MDAVIKQDTRKVYKGNAIVAACNKMTLIEQRLLLLAIAKIDLKKPIPSPLSITVAEYAETYGQPVNDCYALLKSATAKLFERQIVAIDDDSGFDKIRWLSRARYVNQSGTGHLYFSPEVAPYLVNLKTSFTRYELRRIARLNSVHSIRLFELLMRFRATGYYTVSVDNFRELMGLSEGYSRFNNLNGRILKGCIEELEAKSGIEIQLETKRTGRQVSHLTFFFTLSDQIPLPLDITTCVTDAPQAEEGERQRKLL